MAQPRRSDIDGLRAVAVGAVVLFHAGVASLRGGYVGVDIFFVISGYLITNVVTAGDGNGTFSFLDFYERRVRRIIPALVVVLMASTILVYLLYLAPDAFAFSKSLVAAAGFASNFEFMREENYFSPSGVRPLLHIWSLAIEEQFYIVFPVLVVVLTKISQSALGYALVALVVASFAFDLVYQQAQPVLAFYSPFARAWELLLGALISVQVLPRVAHRRTANVVSILGLVLIAVAIAGVDRLIGMTGADVVLACAGAMLCICANGAEETLAARLLSSRLFVGLGLISYSVYLWHWPLIVFARYVLMRPFTALDIAIVILSSLLLGAASWKYVEQPFRGRDGALGRYQLFGAAALASVILMAVGFAGYRGNGFPQRFTGAVAALTQDQSEMWASQYHEGTCLVGDYSSPFSAFDAPMCMARQADRKNVLLWGDSHAAHYVPGLQQASETLGFHLMQATHIGCEPREVSSGRGFDVCNDFYRHILDAVTRDPPDLVILSAQWLSRPDPGFKALAATVDALRHLDIPVIVVGPSVVYSEPLPSLLARQYLYRRWEPFRPSNYTLPGAFRVDEQMRHLFERESGVTYLPVLQAMCPAGNCITLIDGSAPIFWDEQHLTGKGSSYIAGNVLTPALARWLSPAAPVNSR